MLRAGCDADADAFIALVSTAWAGYPGCVFDLDGEVPELRALATYFETKGGALWVAEEAGTVVGMVAVTPMAADGCWELHKMYVAGHRHGDGTALALLEAAESHARARGARRLQLASDTRFERAHRFYEKHGYVRAGPIRALRDKSHTIEFGYAKPVSGVELLDAAGAASAVVGLAALLIACVAAGASVSYVEPPSRAVALAFWRKIASAVAIGDVVLFAAWLEGRLAGTVQLDLATPPNQPHRAELRKLLVAPWARRRGLARTLMAAAQAEAAARGRHLLTLDTRAGDAAEPLYRDLGWTEAGRIPGYSLNPDGGYDDTIIFYVQMRQDGRSERTG